MNEAKVRLGRPVASVRSQAKQLRVQTSGRGPRGPAGDPGQPGAPGDEINFPTVASAVAATIDPAVIFLRTAGFYAAGDGGCALYRRVLSEPAHGGKFHSADGAWWELAEAKPTMLQFGGKDDASNNNDAAYAAAESYCQATGYPLRWLPRTGDAWNFGVTDDFSGIAHDATDQPLVTGPFVYNHGTINVVAGRLRVKNTGATEWVAFDVFQKPDLSRPKEILLSSADADTSVVTAIDMSTFSVERIGWPSDDSWTTASAGMGQGSDFIGWTIGSLEANEWSGAFFPVRTGREYKGGWHGDGGIVGVFIRCEAGYILVYQSTGSAGAQFVKRTYGGSSATTTIAYPDGGSDQAGYRFGWSTIGVRIVAPDEFQVSINGVDLLGAAKADGPILDIGWAVFGSGSGTMIADNFVHIENGPPPVPKPRLMLFSGDSNTDKINPGYPEWMKYFLQSSCGIQIDYENDIGVAGHTAAQQLTAIQNTDLTGYTDATVMVGTNDIQAQTLGAAFKSTMEDIVDELAGVGISTILVVPPMFYAQSEAVAHGGVGQNTAQSAAGSFYRNIIMRVVAEKAAAGYPVALVDANTATVPNFAYHLDWNAAGKLAIPGVFDNIHLEMQSRIALGWSLARKKLSMLCPPIRRRYPAVATSVSIPSGWYRNSWSSSIGPTARFWIDDAGYKHFDGIISTSAGSITDGTLVLVLPRYLRPRMTKQLPALTNNLSAPGWVQIGTNGEVFVYGVDSSNKWIRLSDITYD